MSDDIIKEGSVLIKWLKVLAVIVGSLGTVCGGVYGAFAFMTSDMVKRDELVLSQLSQDQTIEDQQRIQMQQFKRSVENSLELLYIHRRNTRNELAYINDEINKSPQGAVLSNLLRRRAELEEDLEMYNEDIEYLRPNIN